MQNIHGDNTEDYRMSLPLLAAAETEEKSDSNKRKALAKICLSPLTEQTAQSGAQPLMHLGSDVCSLSQISLIASDIKTANLRG